jgi:uncharacterized protein YuzE
MILKETLPYLVLDLESALAHLGRGALADQLGRATIERWTYDENSGAAYLFILVSPAPGTDDNGGATAPPGETVSVYDELGINIDTDSQGRVTCIEILDGRSIAAQLDREAATSLRSP